MSVAVLIKTDVTSVIMVTSLYVTVVANVAYNVFTGDHMNGLQTRKLSLLIDEGLYVLFRGQRLSDVSHKKATC